MDAGGLGLLLLDSEGRITKTNAQARAMLQAVDAVANRNGCLVARGANNCAVLRRALQAALPHDGHMASDSTFAIRRDTGLPLFVQVSPAKSPPDAALANAAAFVVLEDPSRHIPADKRRLGKLFALTSAEQRIAVRLVTGDSASAIAAEISRSEATVRWHIQRMKAKFNCRRLSDLVCLFSRVSF